MQYRTLGSSGLKVSTITLGTMGYAGTGWATPVGHLDVDDARRQLSIAREAGVNLIDTADAYSAGESERILGEALGTDRDEVLIATKVRMAVGENPGPNHTALSRHHNIKGAEASLRRLGTDVIDLYQVHEWDGLTPLEETMTALDDLVRAGKVRYIGASNYSGWQLMKAMWVADRRGTERFVSQQIYYSLQSRDAEMELVPLSIDQGVGILVWSPLAGGLLSGKYRRGQDAPEGTRRFEGWDEPPVNDTDRLYDTIDVLVKVGEAHGVSAAQVALAWTLAKPAVTSLVIGARTDEQLRDNLASADLELTADEIARLDAASLEPLRYPHWHQLGQPDRIGPATEHLLRPHLG